MAYISSKVYVTPFNGSGFASVQAWTDDYLGKLATAFNTANNAWSQVGSIETIGTNTNTNYGCRTLQLYSNLSRKYVRIWCFGNSAYCSFQEGESQSGDHDHLKLCLKNLFREGENNITYAGSAYGDSDIHFAVSDHSIDCDFAKDLGLSVGMFGVFNSVISASGGIILAHYNYGEYKNGGILSVITDGKMFGIIRQFPGEGKVSACFYAPDMLICANSGDDNTEGVITCRDSNDNFYFGEHNSPYSAENYIRCIFNNHNGEHDFRGYGQGIYNGKDCLLTSENCTNMACAALKTYMNINTYAGSTQAGVINGIGFKGWINPDYVRSVHNTVLPSNCRGLKYGSGRWLCMDAGTLICWDNSNSTPFAV